MKFIADLEVDIAEGFTIGGKARNLFRLNKSGLVVPKWIVIPQETLTAIFPSEIQLNE